MKKKLIKTLIALCRTCEYKKNTGQSRSNKKNIDWSFFEILCIPLLWVQLNYINP